MNKSGIWRQRIAYGATDMAGNMIWQMVSLYLLFYYTTISGISAAFVGTLFLVVRVVDAFDGMFYGYLIDHTHTKWGQARPYFLWFGIPLGILGFLLFAVPSFSGSETLKLVYVSAVYVLFSLVYSGANTPITAILPNLTEDVDERTNLATARMVMTNIGATAVGMMTIPIVKILGGKNSGRGYFLWALILGVTISILFVLAFLNLREKNYQAPVAKEKSNISLKETLKGASENKPWLILSLVTISIQVFWVVRNATGIFYINYIYGQPALAASFLGLGFVSVLGNLLVPVVSKRFTNKQSMAVAMVVFAFGELLLPVAEKAHNVPLLFAGNIISLIAMGITFTMVFTMLSDTVDYSRKELGINEPGFLSSVPIVGAKLGMGIGGALSGWILAWGGFDAKAKVQTPKAMMSIDISFVWLPIILAFVILFLLSLYKLDEKALRAKA
ncbi:MFS transporter [Enterococcus devriesei]|uniref:MFS transporter n=1 Tax=Enterococcus devriesei TaxID=319970 RepID=UPI001C0FB972|nr:MFS transporter [Enterococcus devriesei]MBU5365095.1 MFS transporter [Enterococcus devriesei]